MCRFLLAAEAKSGCCRLSTRNLLLILKIAFRILVFYGLKYNYFLYLSFFVVVLFSFVT